MAWLSLSLRVSCPTASPRDELARFLAAVDAHVLALTPGKAGPNGKRKAAIADAVALDAWCRSLSNGLYEIINAADGRAARKGEYLAASTMLSTSPAWNGQPPSGSIDLTFDARSPSARAGVLEGAMLALARFAEERSADTTIGTFSGLSVDEIACPRLRPPRDYDVTSREMLVELFDARAVREEQRATIDILARSPLPAGPSRMTIGEVSLLDWRAGVMDASLPALLVERQCTRESWLAAHLDAPPRDGWNALGDVADGAFGLVPHPLLGLYWPMYETGYCALHGAQPAPERAERLARAAGWKAAGQAGGTPVREIVVVTDSRESALAVRADVLAAGLARVVYTTDGKMWDPFPDGSWREA